MKKPKVEVIQDPDGEPIAVEIIAAAIVEVADGMRRVEASRLNRRALVTLIMDATTGLRRVDIETVLNALGNIDRHFLKPKIEKP